jgi:hypothetical protein
VLGGAVRALGQEEAGPENKTGLGDHGAGHETEPGRLGSPSRGSQVTEGGPDGGNTVVLSQKVPHRAGGRREADWLAGLHRSRQPEEANQSS